MRDRAQIILIVGLVVAVYAASLPGTFQYDDYPTILQNEAVRNECAPHSPLRQFVI